MDHVMDPVVDLITNSIQDGIKLYISDQYKYQFRITESLRNLKKKLTKIQAGMEKATIQQNREQHFVEWLNEFKDAIYDAEDVLDTFNYQRLEGEDEKKQNSANNAKCLKFVAYDYKKMFKVGIKFVKRLIYCDEQLNDLRNIIGILDSLGNDMPTFLQVAAQGPSNATPNKEAHGRRTTSTPDELKLCGRDEEKRKIMTLLKDDKSVGNECHSVLFIVGMGGVGKTTLAQAIYNDDSLKDHFHLKAWVCVALNFTIERLMIAIMESAEIDRPQDIHHQGLESVEKHLKKGLKGKRFFIVLDDVWETMDISKWRDLCKAFRFGQQGSKIMVTTRTSKFVNLVQASKPIELSPLDCESYKELFLTCAFGEVKPEDFPELKDIGVQIANMLGGLPLAAKAVGAVLRSDIRESHWQNILKSKAWTEVEELASGMGIEEKEIKRTMATLKLSYDYLPTRLQQCFIYCSRFPKNYRFRLIDFASCWTTQGLVKENTRNERSSMLVRNYVLELLNRSFLISKEGYYVIHDLFHDLATSIAGEEFYRVRDDNTMNTIPQRIRHLFVDHGNLDIILEKISPKRLRSLIYFNPAGNFTLTATSTNKLTSLRLLYIHSHYEAQDLKFICQLKHLRSFRVEGRLQTSASIDYSEILCKLYQLETLLIPHGQFRGLHKLINLHVVILSDLSEDALYKKLSQNELVSSIDIEENGCKISDLRYLNKIDDDLEIQIKSHVSLEQAKEAKLIEKQHIEKLCFDLRGSNDVQGEIFEELQPHKNLKVLGIFCSRGGLYTTAKLPSWINTVNLGNLRHIVLFGCHYLETFPHLGELPYLEIIMLVKLASLKAIGADFYGEGDLLFPSLKRILLDGLRSLEHWYIPTGIPTLFPRLLEFNIIDCPKLKYPAVIPFPIPSSRLEQYAVRVRQALYKTRTETNMEIWKQVFFSNTTADYNFPSMLTFYIPDLSLLIENNTETHPKIQLLKKIEWYKLSKSQLSSLSKLSSLEELTIRYSIIESLASGILPSSLKRIHIGSCYDLIDVEGIEILPSLEELIIEECPKIKIKTSLPLTIKKLHIKTYGIKSDFDWRHSGAEWKKICRIPEIMINGENILHELEIKPDGEEVPHLPNSS